MDHTEQLQRIYDDMERIAREKGWLGWISGLNLALLFLSILSAIVALIALAASLETGGASALLAFVLLAIAIIMLLLHLLIKMFEEYLIDGKDEHMERLKRELESKLDELKKEAEKLKSSG